MSKKSNSTSDRKKAHIDLCLTDDVAFKNKTAGFENYEFEHYAITEVELSKIVFKTTFFEKNIDYPFLISCMTGGTQESGNINAQLAIAAQQLNIAMGVGSQRQVLENDKYIETYKIIRKNAPKIPVLGNLGASEVVKLKTLDSVSYLVDVVNADAMVIHLNPLQELFQPEGEPNFTGLLKKLEKLSGFLNVPVIVKEVGSGISKKAVQKLLETGVKGIDVAGAGGTSWSGVEMLRTGISGRDEFWDWGLPTAYCIKQIAPLKEYYDFILIGSGGINSAFDAAKALALGSDIAASARTILKELNKNGVEGVISLVENWFEDIRKIMFLTGSKNLKEFRDRNNLIHKSEMY
jgi:isopentenyl-diphosphate delta-isomerase